MYEVMERRHTRVLELQQQFPHLAWLPWKWQERPGHPLGGGTLLPVPLSPAPFHNSTGQPCLTQLAHH